VYRISVSSYELRDQGSMVVTVVKAKRHYLEENNVFLLGVGVGVGMCPALRNMGVEARGDLETIIPVSFKCWKGF
jgi:hypothetical protein